MKHLYYCFLSQCVQRPLLIDPSSRATEWLQQHMSNTTVETITQEDSKFATTLELAVR